MHKNNLRSVIYLFFLLSGMTGLIFQITWFKYLSLFLGNTTYAQTIVLATFLGGLAIGNFLIGNFSDKTKDQLLIYGLIELIIGFYCLLFPVTIGMTENLFFSLVDEKMISHNSLAYTGIKFLISVLILILPTILMGGTLPLLTKFFTENIEHIRRENASLYFLNSFGAVMGIFFAGFIFIKTFGLDVTITIGGVVNILIGSISIFLNTLKDKSSVTKIADDYIEDNQQIRVTEKISKRFIQFVIIVGGLSGFTSLMYEILWTRILIAIFGSSTYSFSIMLMAFISGITIGSFVVSLNFISNLNKVKLLTFSQLMIALTILLPLFIIDQLPYQFWKLSSLFSKTNEAFTLFLSFEFFICFLLMIIPTIFMGMSLPLIVEIVAKQKQLVGYSVGTVFSVNTLGNVLGSIAAGFILIPIAGLKNSFLVGISINLFAVLLMLVLTFKKYSKGYRLIVFFSVLVTLASFFFIPDWNKELMTSGVFRRLSEIPPQSIKEYKRIFSKREILYYKDGQNVNVSVIRTLDSQNQNILLINGKPEASSVGDLPTQLLVGHIPMILHPNPEKIFVIGFGSGSTINAVLKHNPEEVICSEISKEVVEASPFFSDVNENCINDKRVKIIIEDAQSYLKLTDKKFDVIISEPSNPWIAGIGNLFSKEYFERCKERLKPDGIMCQWFHIYEMDDDVLSLVLSTFNSVFPYVQTWSGVQGDLILIGTTKNIAPDFDRYINKFNRSDVKSNLSKIGINNLFTFISTQILSPEGSFIFTSNTLNYERKPLLEFLAPVAFYKGITTTLIYQFDEKFDTLTSDLLIKKYIKEHKVTEDELINAIEYNYLKTKNYRLVFGLSKYLLNKSKNLDAAIKKFLAENEIKVINYNTSELNKIYSEFQNSRVIARFKANQMIAENVNASNFLKIFSIDEAEKILLNHHPSDNLSNLTFFTQLASIFLKNSQPDKALEYCKKAEEILQTYPDLQDKTDLSELFYTYATSAFYLDDYEKVIEYFTKLSSYNQQYYPKKILSKRIEWKVLEGKRQAKTLRSN